MENWKDCMRLNCVQLYQSLDTKNGLQGCMIELDVIPSAAIRRIWDMKDEVRRIQELLDQIKRGNAARFEKFCEALRRCQQEHIVNDYLLRVDPAIGDESDAVEADYMLEKPLTIEIKNLMRKNWTKVVESLTSDSLLLDTLSADKVFTLLQVKQLKDIEVEDDRNNQILRNLEKTSMSKYKKFCTALRKTDQEALACILEGLNREVSIGYPVEETGSSPDFIQLGQAFDALGLKQSTEEEGDLGKPVLETTSQEAGGECIPCRQPPGDSSVNPPPVDSFTYREDGSIAFTRLMPTPEKIREVEELVHNKRAYPCRFEGTKRGHAVIIANEWFDVTNLATRGGTTVDVLNLESLLKHLNFHVVVYRDLTAQGIKDTCEAERKELEKDHTVFICFILSHGEDGMVYGKDGQTVDLEVLTGLFDGNNCAVLVDKPKIFMIQACQGDKITEGVPVSDQADGDVVIEHNQVSRIHEKCDLAVVLATYPGYLAWRNEDHGSHFVQCVTDVFYKNAHTHHFADLITMVNQRMKPLVMRNKFKQTPLSKSTLEKFIYLLPKPLE